MGVSRSAYYAWLERPQTAIEKDDAELIEIIKTEFQKGRKNYLISKILQLGEANMPGEAR